MSRKRKRTGPPFKVDTSFGVVTVSNVTDDPDSDMDTWVKTVGKEQGVAKYTWKQLLAMRTDLTKGHGSVRLPDAVAGNP